jgi:hypothetical protein
MCRDRPRGSSASGGRLRREQRVSRSLTVAELVEAYLARHDVDPVTIDKLRWLLGKAVAVFGDRPVGDLHSKEIAAWRIALSAGYRFDATQALRQVLSRAVLWGMIDINRRSSASTTRHRGAGSSARSSHGPSSMQSPRT